MPKDGRRCGETKEVVTVPFPSRRQRPSTASDLRRMALATAQKKAMSRLPGFGSSAVLPVEPAVAFGEEPHLAADTLDCKIRIVVEQILKEYEAQLAVLKERLAVETKVVGGHSVAAPGLGAGFEANKATRQVVNELRAELARLSTRVESLEQENIKKEKRIAALEDIITEDLTTLREQVATMQEQLDGLVIKTKKLQKYTKRRLSSSSSSRKNSRTPSSSPPTPDPRSVSVTECEEIGSNNKKARRARSSKDLLTLRGELSGVTEESDGETDPSEALSAQRRRSDSCARLAISGLGGGPTDLEKKPNKPEVRSSRAPTM